MGTRFGISVVLSIALCLGLTFTPLEAKKGPTKCEEPTIEGTQGTDELKGTPNADVIAAYGGRDKIGGMGGADTICAGGGNDKVRGRGGKDSLWGGRGNDYLDGDRGRDDAYGHRGNDKCVEVEAYFACR